MRVLSALSAYVFLSLLLMFRCRYPHHQNRCRHFGSRARPQSTQKEAIPSNQAWNMPPFRTIPCVILP